MPKSIPQKALKAFAAEHGFSQLIIAGQHGDKMQVASFGAGVAANAERIRTCLSNPADEPAIVETKEELLAKIEQLTEVLKRPTFVHVLERIEHDGFGNKLSDGYLIFKTEAHAKNYMEAEAAGRGGRRELEAGDFTYLNKGLHVAVPDVIVEIALAPTNKLHIRDLNLLLVNDPPGGYVAGKRKNKIVRAKPGPKTAPSVDEVYA